MDLNPTVPAWAPASRHNYQLHSYGCHGDFIPVCCWYAREMRHLLLSLARSAEGAVLLRSMEKGEVAPGAENCNTWMASIMASYEPTSKEVLPSGFADAFGAVIAPKP